MGRHRKSWAPPATTTGSSRTPLMKYHEASRMADKNAKTIVKVSQLLEIIHNPNYEKADPYRHVEKYVEKLKKRVNRRLKKLAKWSDSSAEERQAEFRVFNRGYSNYGNRNYSIGSSHHRSLPSVPPQHMTIGGGLPSSVSANRVPAATAVTATIGGSIVSNPVNRNATFPLLASALAEQQQKHQQNIQNKTGQPVASVGISSAPVSLDVVREQLQQELLQKDTQREELINQLQNELKGLVKQAKEEQSDEENRAEGESVEGINEESLVEEMDVEENENENEQSVVEEGSVPSSLHAPLSESISHVSLHDNAEDVPETEPAAELKEE